MTANLNQTARSAEAQRGQRALITARAAVVGLLAAAAVAFGVSVDDLTSTSHTSASALHQSASESAARPRTVLTASRR